MLLEFLIHRNNNFIVIQNDVILSLEDRLGEVWN